MRDAEKLLEDYNPLILSVYKRLHPMLSNREDKEDLMSEIRAIFVKLVYEYDLRRGVDFPYYIKRMLELRAYHYVTKKIQTLSREVLTGGFTSDDLAFGAINKVVEEVDDFEKIINLESWDDNLKLGKKQKRLFEGLLLEHKTLRELAAEEGVDVSILHTRIHFLLRKLRAHSEEQRKKEES